MLQFLVRRLLTIVPTLLAVVTLAFALVHMAPGGPFDKERQVSPAVQAQLEAEFHLDWPVFPIFLDSSTRQLSVLPITKWGQTQYFDYLNKLLHGNLGPSTRYPDTSVNELLARGIPATATIGILSLLLSLSLGLSAGLVAGRKPNSAADYGAMSIAMVGICVPSFVLAPLLVGAFALFLPVFPVAGYSSPMHLVLPVICLAGLNAAYIARLSRGAMQEIMPQDFIRTARAVGHDEFHVVTVHALRGALVPVVSFMGPALAFTLTGSLVVETIFNIPGIGRHFVQAALNRDYTLVMGVVIFFSLVLLIANLLVDLAYAWLDPRVRYA